MVGLEPTRELGSTRYFECFFRTAKDRLAEYAPSTAQKNINLGILETVQIPVPPRRQLDVIVGTLDRFMELCDALENARSAATAMSEKFAAAAAAPFAAISRIEAGSPRLKS